MFVITFFFDRVAMVQNCVKFPFFKTNVFYKMYRFPCHCEQWKTRTAPEELMGFFVAEMLKLLCKFYIIIFKNFADLYQKLCQIQKTSFVRC